MAGNPDRLVRSVSIAGSIALLILLGMCWGTTNIPPADFVRDGLLGIVRMGPEEDGDTEEEFSEFVWPAKRPDWKAGVSIHEPGATSGAYTLYTHRGPEEAILIDMNGDILHRWHLPLSRAWDETAAFDPLTEKQTPTWSKAKLEADGDLYVAYAAEPIWPYGRGLVKLDRNSKVIWKNLDFIHHSFDVDADGNVYALAHRLEEETSPNGQLRLPFLNDYLLRINGNGRTVDRIDLAEAIAQSPYEGLFRIATLRQDVGGDYFHSNDVEYITQSVAQRHPYARAGDVLVSVRNLNALVVVDMDSGTVRHVIRGPWGWPHDPDLLDNGNILIFDNMGHIGAGGSTRVVEFDPVTLEIEWQFHGDSTFYFNTYIEGSQQRLDNGNTLITESQAGRIFEVTQAGDIVWEYWNPAVHPTHGDRTGSIRWGERFAAEAIDFPFNEGQIAGE